MEQATSNPLPVERVGTYRLIRLLGEGAMGAVFEAGALTGSPVPVSTIVAVKILHPYLTGRPDLVGRFSLEGTVMTEMSKINGHPNIVRCLAYGVELSAQGPLHYIVMDHLEGASLAERLKRNTPNKKTALKILRSLCVAMVYAHHQGVIHRDLKPENIFICSTGDASQRVKVLDFGIGKLIEHQDGRTLTQTGHVLGTPRYMSPEQITSTDKVGPATDVFAIGCIAYRLLGAAQEDAFPYDHLGKAMLVRMPDAAPVTQPAGIDNKLWPIVSKAMALKLEERYKTVLELLKALDDYCGNPTPRPVVIEATVLHHGPVVAMASPTVAVTGVHTPAPAAVMMVDDVPDMSAYLSGDDDNTYIPLSPRRQRAAWFMWGMTCAFGLSLLWHHLSPFLTGATLVTPTIVTQVATPVTGALDGGVTSSDAGPTSGDGSAPIQRRVPICRPARAPSPSPTLTLQLPSGQEIRVPANNEIWDEINPDYQEQVCRGLRGRGATGTWMDRNCPTPQPIGIGGGYGGAGDPFPYGGLGIPPPSGYGGFLR